MSRKTISRRGFLSGALVGTAAIAGGGLVACAPSEKKEGEASKTNSSSGALESTDSQHPSWLGDKPTIASSDIEEEIQADVIIVGAGVSGVAAARSAGEEGSTVAVFEKAAGPQCRSGEYAVINGSLQARWGRDNMDPEVIINRHVSECNSFVKRSIISRWAYGNAEVFNWWIAAKPDLYICDETRSPVPDEYASCYLTPELYPLPAAYDWTKEEAPTYPSSVEFLPSQEGIVLANMDKAVSDNAVTPYYGYFVEELISENGRITGLYARNSSTGKYAKALAKSVVLACGDYGSNEDMYRYYRNDLYENGVVEMWMNMDVEGNPTNTGDGYRMAMWEGAKIQGERHAPCNHQMAGVGVFGMTSVPTLGIAAYLQLDKHGKRFMNEDGNGQSVEHQLEMLKDVTSYQFFDSAWPSQVPKMQAAHGCVCYVEDGDNLPKNNEFGRNYANEKGIETGVEQGLLLESDTLEELFDKIDIDAEQAMRSIERYNELVHKGSDDDFGKRPDRLFPLENPPYYCNTLAVNPTLVMFGGVESDEECHAYNTDREIIPGLYVCGNMQGNRFAVDYPISLKGASHSMAMYYGYVAGKNAVAQI